MHPDEDGVIERERRYHEKLYAGFAQRHFGRPAVRAFRAHLVRHILRITGAGPTSRVLSAGCGIGDTELLMAPHVGSVVGVDLSAAAVRQARLDCSRLGLANATFFEGTLDEVSGQYDLMIAIFFLHHLPDPALNRLPDRVRDLLNPAGLFYSLDPSSHRLSGAVGRAVIPWLLRRYQTEDEHELDPEQTASLFRREGFLVRNGVYDFASTPLAGLFPGLPTAFGVARRVDDLLLRSAAVRRLGSNFELIAQPDQMAGKIDRAPVNPW